MKEKYEPVAGPDRKKDLETKITQSREKFVAIVDQAIKTYKEPGGETPAGSDKESLTRFLDQGESDKALYEEFKESPESWLLAYILDDLAGHLLDVSRFKDEDKGEIVLDLIMAGREYEIGVFGADYGGENNDYYDFKLALEKLRADYAVLKQIGELPAGAKKRSIYLVRLAADTLYDNFLEYKLAMPKEIKLIAHQNREQYLADGEDDDDDEEMRDVASRMLELHKQKNIDKLLNQGVHPEIAEKRAQANIDRVTELANQAAGKEPAIETLTRYLLEKYPGLNGFMEKLLSDEK